MNYLRTFLFLLSTLGCLTQVRCSEADSAAPATDSVGRAGSYRLVNAYPNLNFTRPIDFDHAADSTNRVFVVEQRGVISVFEDDPATETASVFLDISGPVDDRSNEEGLLGLAFHPDYLNNGYFYVNYTLDNPERSRISRFRVDPNNPNQASRESETVLLEYEQPFGNHNGGEVAFGPDGYLYVGVGDGGSGGDPQGNGQNRQTLLGSILRIDVDQTSGELPYAIPADNPFVGNSEGFREEIYAYGMRNPWRFSFDAETGQLWVGDVGQNKFEEVDIVERGGNYGWDITEATHCFEPESGCDTESLIDPVWEYDHTQGDLSITGGFVYRGTEIPLLQGRYVYADYVSGRVWALDATNPEQPSNTELTDADFSVASFGLNAAQELFLCGFDGSIYRLAADE